MFGWLKRLFEDASPAPSRATVTTQPSNPTNPVLEQLLRGLDQNQASQVEVVKDAEKFENRIRFYKAKMAAGSFRGLSIVALDTCSESAKAPHVIVITGTHVEHVRFEEYPSDAILQKCLPGQGWSAVEASGYYNFSLPNCGLASTKPFDDLVAELRKGLYRVRTVVQ